MILGAYAMKAFVALPDKSASLTRLVAEELAVAVHPHITDFADAIAAPYGDAARAVLFYGSCLRSEQLEGEMLDFYLIVSDYAAAYDKPWMARWNKRLPPNVFPVAFGALMGKVAVLDEADFHALNRPQASAVSVWARFSQPSRLVWAADENARKSAINAISGASVTLLSAALAHMLRASSVEELWQEGYRLTYSAELRAERKDRAGSVVSFAPDRYRAFTRAALPHCRIKAELRDDALIMLLPDQQAVVAKEKARWPGLKRRGKILTLARLAKAAFTYQGGIDYLAWKINRHAGANISITPWQRRHPFVAALFLLPQLWLKGAVR